MASRRKRRREPRSDIHRQSVPGPRSHWRADGAPKVAYGSRAEALTVADERRRESGADLDVYQCDVCHAWHMGSHRGGDE